MEKGRQRYEREEKVKNGQTRGAAFEEGWTRWEAAGGWGRGKKKKSPDPDRKNRQGGAGIKTKVQK